MSAFPLHSHTFFYFCSPRVKVVSSLIMYFRSFVSFSNLNLISIVASYLNFHLGSAVHNISQKIKLDKLKTNSCLVLMQSFYLQTLIFTMHIYVCLFCNLWSISLEKVKFHWSGRKSLVSLIVLGVISVVIQSFLRNATTLNWILSYLVIKSSKHI